MRGSSRCGHQQAAPRNVDLASGCAANYAGAVRRRSGLRRFAMSATSHQRTLPTGLTAGKTGQQRPQKDRDLPDIDSEELGRGRHNPCQSSFLDAEQPIG